MKVFISQKMRDLTEEEILKRRQMIIDLVSNDYEKVEVIESWHSDFDKNSVAQLGQSMIEMSDAELVLISDTSIDNTFGFIHGIDNVYDLIEDDNCDNNKAEHLKGSEFEFLICRSYDIPFLIYSFTLDENGSAISVKWEVDYEEPYHE